mgnify:CR=1 FL=1
MSATKTSLLEAFFDELTSRYSWAFEDLARLEITMLEARKRLGIVRGHSLPMTGDAWKAALARCGVREDADIKTLRGLSA